MASSEPAGEHRPGVVWEGAVLEINNHLSGARIEGNVGWIKIPQVWNEVDCSHAVAHQVEFFL